jgi:type IV secretion system protein VirB9
MNTRLLFAVAALTLTTAAYAMQEPEPSKGDSRIRYVTYDPNNVVLIYSKIGASLLIQFAPDEQLVDMVGGDVDAWGAASTKARNGIFLKPAAVAPETNMQVITNRRTYNFEVKLAPKGKPNYFTVRFRYPEDERKAATVATQKDEVRALLDAGTAVGNRSYTVQGSSELAPIEAWDDGRSTFLRFRARASIPAIYVARGDDDSLEQIERQVTINDVVQIPGVRRKLILRIGDQVACVFNEGFNPNAPRPTTSTASPHVARILKGDGK